MIPAGYYITPEAHIIRITITKAGHSWAERMVLVPDHNGVAVIGWVKAYGLGRDLVIEPLTPRAVSARVRAAVAA